MRKLALLLVTLLFFVSVKADEGMWMLPLIQKLNIKTMQGLGCTLTAEEIYSDKNISLKDAVVIFGNGCTGIMVSPEGLVFTNHHCGYDAIQQHSSVEHNYLKDGFTAKELKDEIPSPDLSVTFLVKIEDITEKVLPYLHNLSEEKRSQVADSIGSILMNDATKGTDYTATVKPMYAGNQYYMFVYEKFNDVRFAYAPPSSIGKFGGETDNWMYPRHTGDFSVFRVYSTPEGKPAEYSPNNVPYIPKRYAAISNQGYQEGDFAMILGNPGSTSRYLTSWGIDERMKCDNMARINIRGIKQDVWKKYMSENEAVNIAYASKYARSSNYWKNSIGMNKAIKKLGVIAQKEKQQAEFENWVNANPARKQKYGNALADLEQGYNLYFPYDKSLSYLYESFLGGVELPMLAARADRIIKKVETDSVKAKTEYLYKDYYPEVDKATFVALLKAYKEYVDADALPLFYQTIEKKYKGNYEKYTEDLFKKSVFTTQDKLLKAINKKKDLSKDPAMKFYDEVVATYYSFKNKESQKGQDLIEKGQRNYEAGLLELSQEKNEPMYPDANFTMRMTYGTVEGYSPVDATSYRYYTTTEGVLQKEDPDDPEFIVPDKLSEEIKAKDFGDFADKKDSTMHVDFLTTNDITGGNSGSPVFNGKGELTGLAFDGNWESLSGDIIFNSKVQRTIVTDIRYILFVMDKIGGADRLIKELTITDK